MSNTTFFNLILCPNHIKNKKQIEKLLSELLECDTRETIAFKLDHLSFYLHEVPSNFVELALYTDVDLSYFEYQKNLITDLVLLFGKEND